MEGSANIWVISRKKINIEGDILVSGLRSDYHVSLPPNHSWKTAVKIMNERVENFNPDNYQPQNTINTHWDEPIKWSKEDEILYGELKHNLRKPLTPIIRKHKISGEKTWNWLERLPECCSIITKYYPEARSAYDPYLYIFETDYEDFIIDLFSELPTSSLFFNVPDKLALYAFLGKKLLGKGNLLISDVNKLYIPLLIRELQKKRIIQKEEHSIVDYHWIEDV